MKVILQKDIKGTGKKGDVVTVSDGHGRNYLIPRGLAKEATSGSVSAAKHHKSAQKKREQEELERAKELAKKIESLKLKFRAKAGEGSRLFGSITTKDVAEKLKIECDIDVDKRKISMDQIKMLGEFRAQVKVHPKVVANLSIFIEEE